MWTKLAFWTARFHPCGFMRGFAGRRNTSGSQPYLSPCAATGTFTSASTTAASMLNQSRLRTSSASSVRVEASGVSGNLSRRIASKFRLDSASTALMHSPAIAAALSVASACWSLIMMRCALASSALCSASSEGSFK